jgi:hypothetical protein
MNPNEMNFVERVVAPCPPFFKTLRYYALVVGGVAATILTGGLVLPAVVTTIAGYVATASAVVITVSQCTVDGDASFDVK